MKKALLAAVVGGFVLGSMSFVSAADEPKKPAADPEKAFKRMDTDSDGKLTLEEFKAKAKDAAKAEARYAKLDKNSDKSVSLEEFKAGSMPKKPKAPK